MWRQSLAHEEMVTVEAGISVSIPVGTSFQFRNDAAKPLEAVAVTMPPWPGPGEALQVRGTWESTA
jgi:mannose-6-phosphate isomerase-like protein (cupin superfamily)